MPISIVQILKYVQHAICLSGFELYYRWVPLKYKPPGGHFWNFTVFLKITFIMHYTFVLYH